MGRIKEILNEPLKNLLRNKSIDKNALLDDYSKGIKLEYLRIKYKISEQLLDEIIKNYVTIEIKNKRKESIEKINKIPTPLEKNKNEKHEKVSLDDAIRGVE